MFWFGHRRRIKQLEEKTKHLESQISILTLALQNIQTAMTATARNQEGIAKDVRDIQNIINTFLQQAEAAAILYGLDPDDGYEH